MTPLAHHGNEGVFYMKPDISLMSDDNAIFILDTNGSASTRRTEI